MKCVYCGELATVDDPKTLMGGRIHARCMDASNAEDQDRISNEAARQQYEAELEAQDFAEYQDQSQYEEQYGGPPEGG